MILIVGATGQVGGRIARRLLEQGRPVRVLVRPGSKFQPLADAGAEPVFGDLKDRNSVTSACRGAGVVITTATAGPVAAADNPQTVDLLGNRNLVDASCAAGVRHFVFVSALFAREDSPAPLLRAKAGAERYLRDSGLRHTILAPNALMDALLPLIVGEPACVGQPVTLIGNGLRRHSLVAADDVASFAVAALDHAIVESRRLVIGGPEPISWRDVIAAYERALGHAIPVRSIPPGEILPGLPPGLVEFISGLVTALDTFDSPIEMDQTAGEFGVRLTTLDEFVRGQVPSMPELPV